MTTNLTLSLNSMLKNEKFSNYYLGQSDIWEVKEIFRWPWDSSSCKWLPPDKFTHLLRPNSLLKKKLSPTLTSFNNLIAKDFTFKLRKKWIRERRRMRKFIVRLDKRTCDYRKSQKLHISCAYVIAVCKHININYL